MFTKAWHVLGAGARGWWNDRAMSMGAAIAFYTLFSLAPVLLVCVAVGGIDVRLRGCPRRHRRGSAGLIGSAAAKDVQSMIVSASDIGTGIVGTTFGAVTFLPLATGVFVELEDDLNLIWKARPSTPYTAWSFIRSRILSIALIVAIGFLLLVSLAIDAALSAVTDYLAGAFLGAGLFLQAVNLLFSVITATALFALMFKALPATFIAWRDVWVGAAMTAILFSLGKFLIGFYLGRTDVASSYGAAASIMTILLWISYSSQILLFGAEFTKAFAERYGSRAHAP